MYSVWISICLHSLTKLENRGDFGQIWGAVSQAEPTEPRSRAKRSPSVKRFRVWFFYFALLKEQLTQWTSSSNFLHIGSARKDIMSNLMSSYMTYSCQSYLTWARVTFSSHTIRRASYLIFSTNSSSASIDLHLPTMSIVQGDPIVLSLSPALKFEHRSKKLLEPVNTGFNGWSWRSKMDSFLILTEHTYYQWLHMVWPCGNHLPTSMHRNR